jgi:fumarate hydratase, class I
MKNLVYPFTEDAVRALKAGDAVSISGRLYTGRDKFHKFFADGGSLPVDFRDGALYHCGPVCVKESGKVERWKSGKVGGEKVEGGGWKVVAAGPTTSVRENPYEPKFIAASGVRLIIGKGGMDAATLAAMKKHGCVYIQAVGGAGALYAAAVKRVAGVSLLGEFGAAEAVWHFDVADFRGIVAMDAHGRSLFEEVEWLSATSLKSLTSLSTPKGRGNPDSPEPLR